jgi:hypothetical protein
VKVERIIISGLVRAEVYNKKSKILLHFRNKNYAQEFIQALEIVDDWGNE